MGNFDGSFNWTLKHEGGYADIEGDSGGKTRYGITEKVARHYGYKGIMSELPLDMAKKIYLVNYWTPLKLNHVSPPLADQLFDHGVNAGIRTAGKIFQKAINYYNNNHRLKVDGIVGTGTLVAYKDVRYKGVLLNIVKHFRFKHYEKIILFKPWLRKFRNSWLRRI